MLHVIVIAKESWLILEARALLLQRSQRMLVLVLMGRSLVEVLSSLNRVYAARLLTAVQLLSSVRTTIVGPRTLTVALEVILSVSQGSVSLVSESVVEVTEIVERLCHIVFPHSFLSVASAVVIVGGLGVHFVV